MQYIAFIFTILLSTVFADGTPILRIFPSSYVEFTIDKKTDFITVQNIGSGVGYVLIQVKEVSVDEKGDVQVGETAPKSAIASAPSRIKLNPNQSRKVKLINRTKNQDKDVIYKVEATTVEVPKDASEEESFGFNISVGVGTATNVIVRAENPEPKVTVVRDKKRLTVTNTGNTTVDFFDLVNCQNKQCAAFANQIIYPGEVYNETLTYDVPVTYTIKAGMYKETFTSD